MSLWKTIMVTVIAHIVILSLIWVGFPVPLPRESMELSYSGSFMPTEDRSSQGAFAYKQASGPSIDIRASESGDFAPWLKMRDLNKPRK